MRGVAWPPITPTARRGGPPAGCEQVPDPVGHRGVVQALGDRLDRLGGVGVAGAVAERVEPGLDRGVGAAGDEVLVGVEARREDRVGAVVAKVGDHRRARLLYGQRDLRCGNRAGDEHRAPRVDRRPVDLDLAQVDALDDHVAQVADRLKASDQLRGGLDLSGRGRTGGHGRGRYPSPNVAGWAPWTPVLDVR